MKRLLLVFTALSVIGFNACTLDPNDSYTDPIPELKSSDDSVMVDSKTLGIEAYLWRDFMPIAEPNGSPLYSLITLKAGNHDWIPDSIELVQQWVIYQNAYWKAPFTDTVIVDSAFIQGMSSGGPKWGPSVRVDVVCDFKVKGVNYRLIDRNVLINRTE